MSSIVVPCRTCSAPTKVPSRSRRSDHYCSDACRPRCDYPGCTTAVAGLGSRCWHHRSYDIGPTGPDAR